jgi:hypothetical protein
MATKATPAAALEHVHNATDDPPVIRSLDAANIGRQMRLDPRPLFVAQPEQISAHESFPQYESLSYCWGRRINEF